MAAASRIGLAVTALALFCVSVRGGAGGGDDPPSALSEALSRLAARADLHHSLLYRIQCDEAMTRMVHRRVESGAGFGFQPELTEERLYGVLVTRDREGRLREDRVELDGKRRVRMTRKGEPRLARLPEAFAPLARAFPHAQVAWFTAEYQKSLAFELLDAKTAEGAYRLRCPSEGDLLVEFLDAEAPRRTLSEDNEPLCNARPSGQMCLAPDTGEIHAIAFYGLYPENKGCLWDRNRPFAVIEQALVERGTGARFPSRVRTVVPLDDRDTAVLVQTFENCRFTNVEVSVSPSSPPPPPP